MFKNHLKFANKANTTPVKGAIRSAITSWIQHRWKLINEGTELKPDMKWMKRCNGCVKCATLMDDVVEAQRIHDSNIVQIKESL